MNGVVVGDVDARIIDCDGDDVGTHWDGEAKRLKVDAGLDDGLHQVAASLEKIAETLTRIESLLESVASEE